MEFEVKYNIDQRKVVDVEYWLDRALVPDPTYPDSIVSSIYFDSFSLNSFREKLDGDYLKTKYRIRWYGPSDTQQSSTSSAVAQVKRKIGNRRLKESLPLDLAPSRLDDCSLGSSELIEYRRYFDTMNSPPETALFPVVLVRYRRKRYLEQSSGLRVCIDYDINAASLNVLIINNPRSLQLCSAVVELKGARDDLPPALQPLLLMGCRKTEFSKYASCLLKLTQDFH